MPVTVQGVVTTIRNQTKFTGEGSLGIEI